MLTGNKYNYKGYEIHEDLVNDSLRFYIQLPSGSSIECTDFVQMIDTVDNLKGDTNDKRIRYSIGNIRKN